MKQNNIKSILVVAAHPDDEILGCGGTIAKHVTYGDEVFVVFLSDGVISRIGHDKEDIKKRKFAAECSKSLLGIKEIIYFDFPDNSLDTFPNLKLVQNLELIISKIKPSIVYTHHYGDLNIDHQIANRVVATAIRPTPINTIKKFYGFEVLSSTDWSINLESNFKPNVFVDISRTFDQKISALECYSMELRPSPHSRSISNVQALAKMRGHSVGVEMAEAFMLYRQIG